MSDLPLQACDMAMTCRGIVKSGIVVNQANCFQNILKNAPGEKKKIYAADVMSMPFKICRQYCSHFKNLI